MSKRISAGPYTLELPDNGVALLYEADEGGNEHRLPGGIGELDALIQFAGEIIRLRAMVDTIRIDRNDQDVALADAIRETASTADELAFWRYQAIWIRAYLHNSMIEGRPSPEDSPAWERAERELEALRRDENKERYTHAEAPRGSGGT